MPVCCLLAGLLSSELAAEIRRHLAYEPVLASPPNAAYRLRRFVGRHRAGVIAATLVLIALIAGIVGTTAGLIRARQAERVARDESETARQVTEFLLDTFRGAVADVTRGAGVVREA